MESRNPICALKGKGKSGTTVRHETELKFLEHIQTLQQKLNTVTFVSPSQTQSGGQSPGDVAAGFLLECTLISVKENIQNCHTFKKKHF